MSAPGAEAGAAPSGATRGDGSAVLILLAAVGVAVLLVDPLRETPMEDDWAYAWGVRNLLETGRYQLHDWLAANNPFQAYWAALFASVAGYSFGVLRASTLVLSAVGVVAFYFLAREHRFARGAALVLALLLWTSPLYLRFSFNFMTDVPFTATYVTALLFYTRAIARDSWRHLLVGSLIAAACILTRQFGVALAAGLGGAWLLNDRRAARIPFYLAGLVAPALATLWQIYMGFVAPNWSARYSTHRMEAYLSDPSALALHLLSRPAIALEYMVIFALPLLVLAVIALARGRASAGPARRRDAAIWAAAAGFIAAGHAAHHALGGSVLMPTLLWNFVWIQDFGTGSSVAATVITTGGAVLFLRLLLLRYLGGGWAGLAPAERLLDLSTLASLGLMFLFWQIGDEYLLVFIPYTILTLGRALADELERRRVLIAVLAVAIGLAATLWTRSLLASNEIVWAACEDAVSRGVPAAQIYGDWTWSGYHDFAAFAESVDPTTIDTLNPFRRWLAKKKHTADHLVIEGAEELRRTRFDLRSRGLDSEVLQEYSYTPLPGLPPRPVYLLRRDRRDPGR